MGELHETNGTMTAKELAKQQGVTTRAINLRWNAKFPGEVFDSNAELSPIQVAVLREAGKRKISVSKARRERPAVKSEGRPPASDEVKNSGQPKRRWVMYSILAGPTFASVENMYSVTHDLAHSWQTAAALTAVLSLSAIGFVWYGVRAWWSIALAVLLIAFESFCNLTRIYGGLMGVGDSGNPTRFLGLVTDIFNSGSHQTAIGLGAFTAFFIAAVQYAAVFELNKK